MRTCRGRLAAALSLVFLALAASFSHVPGIEIFIWPGL
jgi:hypothetical protein